jgi:hypothetical protein
LELGVVDSPATADAQDVNIIKAPRIPKTVTCRRSMAESYLNWERLPTLIGRGISFEE